MTQHIRLSRNSLWSLEPSHRGTITCRHGSLWLTQAGNPQDVLLSAGESFTAAARGKIVISALEDAAFTVAPHAPARPRGRIARRALGMLRTATGGKHLAPCRRP